MFIDALTKGGQGGALKPIEMHADDPKRYVGDMLALLHQIIPSEHENLQALLKTCSKTGVITIAPIQWFVGSLNKIFNQ